MGVRFQIALSLTLAVAATFSPRRSLAMGSPSGGLASTTAPACRLATLEGEIQAGHAYEKPIGNGLKILLEPLASGWILRVLPEHGPRGRHDYAELATPPYQSVSPLLLSTDFSFRAQDALAWNPRYFRFAVDPASFARLTAAYNEEQRFSKAGPASAEAARLADLHLAESRLAMLVGPAAAGELTIVDARFVQGTADQAQTAAMVASHLSRSAHQVDQPSDGRPTALGSLNWVRFRIRLDLPREFRVNPALTLERSACF